jgi:hypothetical protein
MFLLYQCFNVDAKWKVRITTNAANNFNRARCEMLKYIINDL